MKEKKLKITQVAINASNPRTITEDKFNKLISSILVLPKMLEVRPVVVDSKFVALGGNMRIKALQSIAEMSADDIASRLAADKTYSTKNKAEQDALLAYWAEWLAEPYINTVVVDNFSEAEQKEFIIKDNVSFGKWDWDMLANEWDTSELEDWGMEVWDFADENKDIRSENVDELKDLSDKIVCEFKIEVDCLNEQTQEKLFNELNERGLKCRILTL